MADLSPAKTPAAVPEPPGSPDRAAATGRSHGLDAVTGSKPRPEPLDPPMVPFALGGIAAFAVVGVILLLAGAPDRWLWTCLAGVLSGIPGLLTMLKHDANRRHRRALSHPEFTINGPA